MRSMRTTQANNSNEGHRRILSRIEELMKPLGKVSKTWYDHLAKSLDEYMECIEELSQDEDLGLTSINFVQAGMIIESTTKVYAVNVDCLWQFMTEVLEILRMNKRSASKRRCDEVDSTENPEEGPKRRKKGIVFEDFKEITPKIIDADMRKEEKNEPIKLLPAQRHIIMKPDLKNKKLSYRIFDTEGDSLDPSDYSVMFQTSRVGKLQYNMMKDMITETDEAETSSARSSDEVLHVLQLLIRELSLREGRSFDINDVMSTLQLPGVENDSHVPGNPLNDACSVSGLSEDAPTEPGLELPPSPLTIKRSASEAAESPVPMKRSLSDAYSDREVCAGGLTTRQREKEAIVTVTCDPWAPIPFEGGMPDKPLTRRQTFKIPCDVRLLNSDEKKRKTGNEERVKIMMDYYISNMMCSYLKNSYFPIDPEFSRFYLDELDNKKRWLSKPPVYCKINVDELRFTLAQDYLEDFGGFEDYEADPGEEEGFRGFRDDMEPDYLRTGFHGFPVDDDDDEFHGFPDDAAPDNGFPDDAAPDNGVQVPKESVCNDNDAIVPDYDGVPAALDLLTDGGPHLGSSENADDFAETSIIQRVAEWEHFIRPKLKVARDRGHFDIHGFGTKILDSFPKTSAKFTLQFSEFTEDKPMEDIPRYFLAALQLANTYNIEITKSEPGELSMDCMEMTLLSSIRHHEALEEYEAPSEGARRRNFIIRPISGYSESSSDSESSSEYESSSSTHKRKCNKR